VAGRQTARNVIPQRAGDVGAVDENDRPTGANVGVLDRGAVNLDLGRRISHWSTLARRQTGGESARRCRYRFTAAVVYQWCGVCPVLAVVGALAAGVLELDVDEDDAPVVDAVAVGAVVAGGVAVPFWVVWKHAWSYCDGAPAAL
jgi:hypothetical protein